MNTMFNLAETYLVAALIHHFESKDDAECTKTGWVREGQEVTFVQLFKVSTNAVYQTSTERFAGYQISYR